MTTLQQIIKETEAEFVEKGANLEHERWARWQRWFHEVLRASCPSPELEKVIERWDRQIGTIYSELSETEKESDRRETKNYLPLLNYLILKVAAQTKEAMMVEEIELSKKPEKTGYNKQMRDEGWLLARSQMLANYEKFNEKM